MPLPGRRDVGLGQPFRRPRQNTAQPELPPSPSPDLAIGPGQPLRRPRPNAGHPEPTPRPRQALDRQVAGPRQAPRRTRRNVRQPGRPPSLHRTDLIVGGLVSAAALVVGIVAFPLLPSGTSTGSTTPPPASNHAGTAVAGSGDPGPVGGQLAIQPNAPASPDHAATRGGVTLLSDQTAVHHPSIVPVAAPPAAVPQVAVTQCGPVGVATKDRRSQPIFRRSSPAAFRPPTRVPAPVTTQVAAHPVDHRLAARQTRQPAEPAAPQTRQPAEPAAPQTRQPAAPQTRQPAGPVVAIQVAASVTRRVAVAIQAAASTTRQVAVAVTIQPAAVAVTIQPAAVAVTIQPVVAVAIQPAAVAVAIQAVAVATQLLSEASR